MRMLLERKESIALKTLTEAGYEAYFVGGCVRDALMMAAEKQMTEVECGERNSDAGICVGDIDVTTNALPQQVKEVFAECRVIETGIKHGTVTVLVPKEDPHGREDECGSAAAGVSADTYTPVEITTYRSDGTYSDSRHPDSVNFVRCLEEDLARRDFTVNAMACDLEGNIVDLYGGQQDLDAKIIRTVGEPDKRFQEDALRIMRGLRFAAVLGFEIEEETAAAMFRNRVLLENVSAERVFVELKKLLAGKYAGDVLRKYVDILDGVLPELAAMKGFQQHNPYHKYDVLEHCIRAMEAVRTTPENRQYMKMAVLFHDMGKPDTYFMDDEGIGHFYGHPKKSEEMVRRVLGRLKADKATIERVAVLVKYHDLIFDKDERLLKRWMNRLGADVLREILEIKLADNIGTGNMSPELGQKFAEIRDMMGDILAQQQCFSLKDLAVSGNDLIAEGLKPGPELGRVLNELLEAVIDGECENEKEALMEMAHKIVEREAE